MRPLQTALMALCLFASPLVTAAAPNEISQTEWGEVFARQDARGTLVVLDQRTPSAQRQVYNTQRAAVRYSPASTFKIPHTLIALDRKVVSDEFTRFAWDGVNRGNPLWNREQDLRSAMRNSVVWVFQDLARRIGAPAERDALARLDYGNRSVGQRIDDFWLDGSLRISAHEQVDFLERLYRNALPYPLADQRLVKDLMLVDAGRDHILRAKTGWFSRHGESIGWWVGWIERPDGPVFFALNIDMPAGIPDAPKREAIVRQILHGIGALPARP